MNEAIKLLENIDEQIRTDSCGEDFLTTTLQQIRKWGREALVLLRAQPCEDWIPVSERLPKGPGFYWAVWDKTSEGGNRWATKAFWGGKKWEAMSLQRYMDSITYWKPIVLPKPCETSGASKGSMGHSDCPPKAKPTGDVAKIVKELRGTAFGFTSYAGRENGKELPRTCETPVCELLIKVADLIEQMSTQIKQLELQIKQLINNHTDARNRDSEQWMLLKAKSTVLEGENKDLQVLVKIIKTENRGQQILIAEQAREIEALKAKKADK